MGLLQVLLMARGLVGIDASPQETLDAFERLAPDELVSIVRLLTGQALAPVLPPTGTSAAAGSVSLPGLSERDVAILRLVARGRPDREIGKAVSLSEDTVGRHLQRLRRRFGVSTRDELAAIAGREGLYQP
jgi:DNA-binding NarL/FixJ family response regulator